MSTRVIRPLIRSDAANASLGVASAGKIIQADAAGHAAASFIRAAKTAFTSSVSGFTPADVEAAINALASSRMLALISNANGIAARWENGFQICSFNNATGAFVNASVIDAIWVYPASFNAIPAVTPTLRLLTSAAVALTEVGVWQDAAVSASQATLRIYAPAGGDAFASGDTVVYHAIAVGTWK